MSAQFKKRLQRGTLAVTCIATAMLMLDIAVVNSALRPVESSGLLAGVNDAFRQGGIAVGVAMFGALLPSGAAVGHGDGGAYVAALHNALLIGAGLAALGAAATLALIGRRRPQSLTTAVVHEAAPELA